VTRAYILIQTEVGAASASVAAAIGDLKGVSHSDNVTGPYDVIVEADATDLDHLNRDVLQPIQAVPGVTRTLTCPVVNI
jgi:DNA-binding Lrp family transcriptional regulator